MFDSFEPLKNPGVEKAVNYVRVVRSVMLRANCCDAILIYGSMCRLQFHNKSDLDIRVVWRKDSLRALLCLPLAFYLRARSLFIRLPVDLQVVANAEVLRKQMRSDEVPIVVYSRYPISLAQGQKDFGEVERNPKLVLKNP